MSTDRTFTQTGAITTFRVANTVNGNPKYDVFFSPDDGGPTQIGRTKGDSQFLYTMPRSGRVQVRFHRTAGGNIVFDDIVSA
jgi:hypothetical protein